MTESKEQSVDFVKLISADGHEFFLDREVACIAGAIKVSLNSGFEESKGEIRFPEISTVVLEKVIQYLHYKAKYTNSKEPPPEFPIEADIVAEVLMAANYLEC